VILLTGGTGFVGGHVAHTLRAKSRDVRCLVRDPGRGETLAAWGCELARGDVTDAASLKRAAAGCDVVVHLVAIIAGRRSEFERVMEQGTRNLVAAAQEAGARRFVLMSALGLSEETRDLTAYYAAKWEMEQAVKGSGLEHVIFRPSFVFGRDGGVLPLFFRQVRWSPLTPVLGNGKRRLQPIWVDDVAAYLAKSVDLPAAADRTFEIGGPDAVTWNGLYERIAKVLGKRRARVNVPFSLVRPAAALVERLPRPPITRDQLKMLEAGDNVCDLGPALEAFGLGVLSLDEQLRRAV
jgi:NADH dehydrogenase